MDEINTNKDVKIQWNKIKHRVVVQHEMIYSCDKKRTMESEHTRKCPNFPEATVIHLLSLYVIYGVC